MPRCSRTGSGRFRRSCGVRWQAGILPWDASRALACGMTGRTGRRCQYTVHIAQYALSKGRFRNRGISLWRSGHTSRPRHPQDSGPPTLRSSAWQARTIPAKRWVSQRMRPAFPCLECRMGEQNSKKSSTRTVAKRVAPPELIFGIVIHFQARGLRRLYAHAAKSVLHIAQCTTSNHHRSIDSGSDLRACRLWRRIQHTSAEDSQGTAGFPRKTLHHVGSESTIHGKRHLHGRKHAGSISLGHLEFLQHSRSNDEQLRPGE